MKKRIAGIVVLFIMNIIGECPILIAQESNYSDKSEGRKKNYWKASWIAPQDIVANNYGVFCFRRTFIIENIPDSFPVYVSADNRYELYINGQRIGMGPARGDLFNWRYEEYDLTPYLRKGKNVLAAQVVNFGEFAPVAQMSNQTAFILQQGEYENATIFTGDKHWKVAQNPAYSPLKYDNQVPGYYAAGPGDLVDYSKFIWNWQAVDFDDSSWQTAKKVADGKTHGARNNSLWYLTPRTIPPMEEKMERFYSIRDFMGIPSMNPFIQGGNPLIIPPNSTVTLLIDNQSETVGFPVLTTSKGKNSKIKLTYSESLYHPNKTKGNRNEIEGKKILGYSDIILPDGGLQRTFSPLWWRTFRYIQMNIETGPEELIIEDFYNRFTAYPFQLNASFESNDANLTKLWDMCWRTSRLCAFETYMDCPYYEQLNYIGDTRIQALVSLYLSGDDRLMKDAITLFESSRNYLGITQARYPTRSFLIIPPYSLFLIGMEHDFLMYRNSPEFIKPYLPGMEATLNFYKKYLNDNYLLEKLDWWQFTDWSKEFTGGMPPETETGQSANLSLQYLYAIQQAVEIFRFFGKDAEADYWNEIGEKIGQSVMKNCYDSSKQLIAETPEKKEFSQHSNIMALLTNIIPADQQKQTMLKILEDKSLHQTTLYFKFYLFKALKQTGMGDLFTSQLATWYSIIEQGYSTCGETGEPHHDRSDCHAWSASPAFFFLNLIAGIESEKPGFNKISIAPSFATLNKIKCSMPHPSGIIELELSLENTKLSGKIILPDSTTGNFTYGGKSVPLDSGINTITIDLP